jgi:iron-sulfur cluster assembly protein
MDAIVRDRAKGQGMSQQVLSVTPAAVGRVRHLLETLGEGAAGVRVGVRTAGCSGLTYTIDFANEIRAEDQVIEVDGVRLVIDPQAVMYLVGAEMDFVEDRLGASFQFRNPNESGRCGCGESFTV